MSFSIGQKGRKFLFFSFYCFLFHEMDRGCVRKCTRLDQGGEDTNSVPEIEVGSLLLEVQGMLRCYPS